MYVKFICLKFICLQIAQAVYRAVLQWKLAGSKRKRYPFHTGQSAPVIIGTNLNVDKIPLNYHSEKLFNVCTAPL